MELSGKVEQQEALDKPTGIATSIPEDRTGSNDGSSSNNKRADRRALMQRNHKASNKNFRASSRRNMLQQRYGQSYGRSKMTQAINEGNMDDSFRLQDSFRIDGSVKNAVNETKRSFIRAKEFLSKEDSQPILFGDDDDDLLHELEGLSGAEKDLVQEMEEANKMFPGDEQLDFDSQMSELDMSWAAGELSNAERRKLLNRMSSIRSVGTCITEEDSKIELSPNSRGEGSQPELDRNSNEVILESTSKARKNIQVPPQNDDENSITLDDIFTAEHVSSETSPETTMEKNKPAVAKELSSVHDQGDDKLVPNTARKVTHPRSGQNMVVLNTSSENERLKPKNEEATTVSDNLASSVFGGHEYTIRLDWTDKTGNSLELTRTYEGGLLVYLSSWIFISYFYDKVPHKIFWTAALIVPPTVTTVEIHLPHSIDEAIVALGILSCHFVLGKCMTM